MPLFRKFPEIRKFELCFRKYVAFLCIVARPNNACNFEVQEIFTYPSGISVQVLHIITENAQLTESTLGGKASHGLPFKLSNV